MDKYTKSLLTVIAVSVSLIAVKMYFPYITQGDLSLGVPTFGEYNALRQVVDADTKKERFMRLTKRLPIVRVQGGQIDADVSGSVEIER